MSLRKGCQDTVWYKTDEIVQSSQKPFSQIAFLFLDTEKLDSHAKKIGIFSQN